MRNGAHDPLVGTRIREYEILDVIGKGGMGSVYRARHIYLDEERAIKVINAPLTDEDSPFIDRFIREAKILTKLHHPDLVVLHEFGRLDEKMFFMVMELMQGESVQERIKRLGRIPITDSLRIIRQAANGLHVAHERGIVHRDISPDNLMLLKLENGTEITKVIDFGIAKPTYRETHKYTIGDMFVGKPQYSSPEQLGFHEEGEEIDRRADIYSLAITLYYMLSGKLPFYSETPQGYIVKHASQLPKPISTHFAKDELPEGVEKLIDKALSKKREQRQATMAEFAEEIERIQNSAASSANSFPVLDSGTEKTEAVPGFPPLPSITETHLPVQPPTKPSTGTVEMIPADSARYHSDQQSESIAAGEMIRSPGLRKSSGTFVKFLVFGIVAASILIALVIWFFAGSIPKTEQTANKTVEKPVIQKPETPIQRPAQEVHPEAVPPPLEQESETEPPVEESTLTETTLSDPPSTDPILTEPPQVEPPLAETPKVETPKIETAAPPDSGGKEYTVEVMATSFKNRAEEKISELNGKGYSSFLGENNKNRNKYRVRVGRFKEYAAAKEMSARLKKELQMDPWVVTVTKSSSSETPASENAVVPTVQSAQPITPTDGTVSFEAAFPAKVFNGKNLVLDTALTKSQSLKAGKYNFTVNVQNKTLIGNFKHSVEVKPGENTVIPAPAVGYLSINANPNDCRITIDEWYQDVAPVLDLPLLAGKHRILVEWRSLEIEDEVTIEISEDKKTRLRAFVTDDSVGVVEE